MWYVNLKSLRTKILFGYLLLLLITMMVSFWAIYNFMRLREATNNIMVENYRSVVAAENMVRALERQDSAELMFLFNQQPESFTIFIELSSHVLSLLLGFNIANIIIKPTRQLTESVRKVAEGNLEQAIEINSEDEIGELAREFNKMTLQLYKYEQANISRLRIGS